MPPLKNSLLSLGVYYISVSSCKDCYPATNGKDLTHLLKFTQVFFHLLKFFTHPNGKSFLYFASKCKQMCGLLPGTFYSGSCSVTSNKTKMLPLNNVINNIKSESLNNFRTA